MSAEGSGALVGLVVVLCAVLWAAWPQGKRPSSSDVDPTTLPVGTYWWRIDQTDRRAWRWNLYRRAPLGDGQPGAYDRPVSGAGPGWTGTLPSTRRGALRQVRRAVRRDVRHRGYAASTERGAVKL